LAIRIAVLPHEAAAAALSLFLSQYFVSCFSFENGDAIDGLPWLERPDTTARPAIESEPSAYCNLFAQAKLAQFGHASNKNRS
jgi:hypothetical protein